MTDNKTADGQKNQELQQSEYKPALQRHVDMNRNYLFTSLRVRVFLGEIEKDVFIKIRNQDLTARDVCSAIEHQLKIPPKYTSMFRLWTFGKDIELQLDPEQKMTDLLLKWHIVMLQYTHYTEAATATHAINRYFFVYKRAAILSKKTDQDALQSSIIVQLLYGEAKRNFLNTRYLIRRGDEYKIAAYQLFNRYGIYQEKKLRKIEENPAIISGILPVRYKVDRNTNSKIMREYQLLPKFFDAMPEFVRYMISLPSYGSCYFPVCEERPPLGYFEYRIQRWIIAVNDDGMTIIDPVKKKYIHSLTWETTYWEVSPLDIIITFPSDKPRKAYKTERIRLLSPQSLIIDNVATRAKYLWAKEVLKENMNYNIDNLRQAEANSSTDVLSPGTSKANETASYEEHIPDENIEKKYTSVSQPVVKSKKRITWSYLWPIIKTSMLIKKPGDIPFDIDDGFSNAGSRQELDLV